MQASAAQPSKAGPSILRRLQAALPTQQAAPNSLGATLSKLSCAYHRWLNQPPMPSILMELNWVRPAQPHQRLRLLPRPSQASLAS